MTAIKCYRVKCITNLHVGDGESNYNIIDNQIERDPVNNYPVIFSTGVKGALREHFVGSGVPSTDIDFIFGKGKNAEETEQGNVKFTNAYLLAIPMRASKGSKSFYMVTSPGMLEQLFVLEESLRRIEYVEAREEIKNLKECITNSNEESISVEGCEPVSKKAEKSLKDFLDGWFGKDVDVIIVTEDIMRKHRYPVQARNCLNNGKSENLWYEEYVPHGAIFYFYTLAMPPVENGVTKFFDSIKKYPLAQFGANATVGFGLARVEEVQE